MSGATEAQVAMIVWLLRSIQFDWPEEWEVERFMPTCEALRDLLAERAESLKNQFTLRLASEYEDDLGFVLWWHLPVCEPPEVDNGEALELTDNAGVQWYTHFSILPTNEQIDAATPPKSEEKR